jgi:hypothetical protein
MFGPQQIVQRIGGVFVLVYLRLMLLRFVLKMPRPIAMLTSMPPLSSTTPRQCAVSGTAVQ